MDPVPCLSCNFETHEGVPASWCRVHDKPTGMIRFMIMTQDPESPWLENTPVPTPWKGGERPRDRCVDFIQRGQVAQVQAPAKKEVRRPAPRPTPKPKPEPEQIKTPPAWAPPAQCGQAQLFQEGS